jgi:NADH-quinone oxidoreductase subunit M
MLEELPILSLTALFPLVGVLFILLIKGDEATTATNSRHVALWSSILTFILSILVYLGFDPTKTGYQFVEQRTWIKELGISYHMGIDGISIFFVLLSTFLMPLCILASWEAIQRRVREYMIAFLLLETLMIGMFCALDLVMFYIFFEGVLIPLFLIIGIWGGERRLYSCFKFFLYTFLGSVFMILAIVAIYGEVGSTDLMKASAHAFPLPLQHWLWLAFFVSFAVKIPMWPVHTWLPDAHVEAPTAGSVILAGVLLKMGGYGFLRFSLPLFPEASQTFAPYVMTLSVIAVIYASLVALVQQDMKKLIAYSSIAHMGFVTLGLFVMTPQAVTGAVIQMLSHGLISAALFLAVGVLYDRLHTREIARYGGLVTIMPVYATFFMLFTLASVGLPGTSGFIGEFLVILGSFEKTPVFTTLAATGLILGASYALWLYRRVIFGQLENSDLVPLKDLNGRETVPFLVLGGVVLWMGIYPKTFTDRITPSVHHLVQQQGRKLVMSARLRQVAAARSTPSREIS